MFCCCSVDTCANFWGKTGGWIVCGNAFVVLTSCDCKWWTSQLQTTTEGGGVATEKKKKKKNINYPVKIYKYVRSKRLMGKNCCNIFVSLQLDESIWSIDVNKLELICFKYPLKVNWHCWNRCLCVYGTMGSNVGVFLFVQIKNVASFEIIQRYETSKLI